MVIISNPREVAFATMLLLQVRMHGKQCILLLLRGADEISPHPVNKLSNAQMHDDCLTYPQISCRHNLSICLFNSVQLKTAVKA